MRVAAVAKFALLPLALCCVAVSAGQAQQTQPAAQADNCPAIIGAKHSSFGCYRGYGEMLYREFYRESLYVPVRDGTRLAVDVFRPSRNGKPIDAALPVVFTFSRYWRATETGDGTLNTELGPVAAGHRSAPIAQFSHATQDPTGAANLVAHGYVFVRAEARGTGASFGRNYGDMTGIEALDGYDLVEWLAKQSWSNGKIGMRGHSYPGMAQHLVASTAPPHLVAIFPGVAPFDEYQSSWANTGILRKFGLAWLAREARRDGTQVGTQGSSVNPVDVRPDQVAKVDADLDGSLRAAARAERRALAGSDDPTRYFTAQSPDAARLIAILQEATGGISIPELIELLYSTPKLLALLETHPAARQKLLALGFFRDASAMFSQPQTESMNSLASLMPAINRSRVATYNWGGWFDFASIDTTLWFANSRNQARLTMGPWTHGWNEPNNPREDHQLKLLQIEELRWFDYWLKGVDNGVTAEAPVNYAVIEGPQKWRWVASERWPDARVTSVPWHFDATRGKNLLKPKAPTSVARANYTVDYLVTLGEHTRHHDAIGMGPLDYPDLDAHARQALTFASAPLRRKLTIAGYPILRLWLSADAPDVEVNAYLQSVAPTGEILLVSEGVLLASHRQHGQPDYDTLGLPMPDSRRDVVLATAPLSADQPSLLEFTMQPTAVTFAAGHRLRLVITGADAHTNLTIPRQPAPTVSLWTGGEFGSQIILPVTP